MEKKAPRSNRNARFKACIRIFEKEQQAINMALKGHFLSSSASLIEFAVSILR